MHISHENNQGEMDNIKFGKISYYSAGWGGGHKFYSQFQKSGLHFQLCERKSVKVPNFLFVDFYI